MVESSIDHRYIIDTRHIDDYIDQNAETLLARARPSNSTTITAGDLVGVDNVSDASG